MKILLLAVLGLGGAISAQGQTAATNAAPASPADAAWVKIGDDSQHIAGFLQTHNKAGLLLLAPTTLTELNDFAKKFPSDPKAPQARLLAAQLGNLERQLQMPAAPSADEVSHQFMAIANDETLPKDVRAKAGVMGVNATLEAAENGGGSPAAYDKIESQIVAYQKQFADTPVNGSTSGTVILRQEQMTLLKSGNDPVRYDALIAKLASDPNADISTMAKKAQDDEQTMTGLKSKPLEMTFTALDGSTVDLATLRGKVVLVDFWATWCPPRLAATSDVVAAYNKYHDKGFEIVGISLDQDKASLTKYIADNKMPWPQYFDGKGWDNAISSKYGIQSIPAMWLIGKDGKLVTADARGALDAQIAKALGAK